MSQLKPIIYNDNTYVIDERNNYVHDYVDELNLLNNIEDIIHSAKTNKENPLCTITMIEEQLANYIINCINKYEGV